MGIGVGIGIQFNSRGSQSWVSYLSQQGYVDLGFGAIIHFLFNTFTNHTYNEEDVPVDTFAPTDLDVDQWVTAIKSAGMKYAVFVTKSHDGFALWPTTWAESGYDPYSIAQTTFYANNGHPDIVKLFVDACRKNKIAPCLYFSIWDLIHEIRTGTDEVSDPTSYINLIKHQLNELLTNYGGITAIWFDGWGWHIPFENIPYDDIYNYIKSISPNTLVLNNCQEHPKIHSDIEVFEFAPPEKGFTGYGEMVKGIYHPVMAGATPWSNLWVYSSIVDNTLAGYRTPDYLFNQIRIANRANTSYLLGVMPDTTGHLTDSQISILSEIGSKTYDSTKFHLYIRSFGTGTGVASLRLQSSQEITMTINNNGKFYDDVDGTTNEGTIRTITPGALRTFYVKVTSGNCDIIINDCQYLIKIGNEGFSTGWGWTYNSSTANCPYLYFDLYQLPANVTSIAVERLNYINGDVSDIPINLTYVYILGGNTIYGDIADIPVKSMTNFVVIGSNTIHGDISEVNRSTNASTYFVLDNSSGTFTYTSITWTAILNRLNCSPKTYGLTQNELISLLIDVSAATWTGSTRQFNWKGANPSMADTNQGGIWGDFDGETSPSALATAYKTLYKTKTTTIYLNGITVPGVSGDGAGFPAGFGDWYRS